MGTGTSASTTLASLLDEIAATDDALKCDKFLQWNTLTPRNSRR
jgi:hypothetical protein